MAVVLFVDDECDALETYQKAVELFGHKAILAPSAGQGLSMALENSPDLIFVDMSLPDMDGLNLIYRLRGDDRTACTPVVVLSAGAELDAAERVHAAGAQSYINKPIRLQSLLDLINESLSKGPCESGD
jgi:DNA-binding response OmpR family regulator